MKIDFYKKLNKALKSEPDILVCAPGFFFSYEEYRKVELKLESVNDLIELIKNQKNDESQMNKLVEITTYQLLKLNQVDILISILKIIPEIKPKVRETLNKLTLVFSQSCEKLNTYFDLVEREIEKKNLSEKLVKKTRSPKVIKV